MKKIQYKSLKSLTGFIQNRSSVTLKRLLSVKGSLIAGLLIVLTLGTSCNEWLDVLPENDQVADEYWQTKEEVEAVISACYVEYRSTVSQQLIWGELRGNSLQLNGVINYDLWEFNRWEILPDNDLCKWSSWYKIINLSNMVIEYAPLVSDRDKSFSQSVMSSYVAEAYYLRALAYFFLVRNFREVPLILEPYMNDNQDYEIPKAGEQEIWDQIVADLLIAEEGTKSYFSEPDIWASKGRATKWAVKATMADVYLWTKNYEESIVKCNEVINSGRVGLISGIINENENNWFNIFSEGNTNEGIFELQWDYNLGQNNSTLYNLFSGESSYHYVISQNLYVQFLFSQNDIRGLNASYTLPGGKIWKYIGSTAGNNFVAAEMGMMRSSQEKDQNWIMYRIADVYLMKAEALVMQGNYEAAVEIVNKIRTRAKVTQMADVLPTEMEMIELVLNERAMELVAEGKRWYDLLRVSRISDEYLSYMIDEVLTNASPSRAVIIQAKLRDRNSHYLPVHIDELENNKAMVQNPFYENLN
ncbi:MAG: RagB/SusD family nutrient uptake outer membrane protein [Prolixibacteraceae bacterium]|jgi:hypothetical protein|nr:RagB/SusD family nutrient uptake outer membrane protein [Prolixibacteraceae bacterium]